MGQRTESDSMGDVRIPSELLYGASTQRARNNFQISERKFSRQFIEALGLVKWAASLSNQDLGKLDANLAKVIAARALEVSQGKHDPHFVLDIFQTGSGTSTNMNANEVIANLSIQTLGGKIGSKKPIHPNDHVNCGQSSNDVIPTAIHVGAALGISRGLIPALKKLNQSFSKKSNEFSKVIKVGRTHLQDATPVTLGQEFSGYSTQIEKGIERLEKVLPELCELAIGGTAVGTGINTHPQFATKVCSHLSTRTKLKFKEAKNHFEAQAAKDACVATSGTLKTIAVSLMKIANDIRWLSSGPRCGIGEILLPELQPGSSIMPGKINPVIPESVMQVAAQVQGNDLAIQIGGQHGNFELNVMMPIIAGNLFESIELLTNTSIMFSEKCIDGIKPNRERCEELLEKGLMLVTKLNPIIGYDKATMVAKKAHKENKTLREVLLSEKLLTESEIDKHLDPKTMLSPTSK